MNRILLTIAALLIAGTFSAARAADDKAVIATGKGDEAIAACGRLIGSGNVKGSDLGLIHDSRARALAAKGDHLRAIADFDAAIKLFDEAIKLDPRSADAYYSRARAWRKKAD